MQTLSIRTRQATLLAVAATIAALALAVAGPIAQWADYHVFADARAWLGVPNAANVLSNAAFAVVGGLGLLGLRGARGAATSAWRGFAVAIACTAIGSAIYHWAPSNAALVVDRVPIAWACAAIACAFLAERIDRRWASAPALGAAALLASASVAWWAWTEHAGAGDLGPYLYVQFLPMLLVALALVTRLAPIERGAVPDRTWWAVLATYALAKLVEGADQQILGATAIVSGHTLKHLLAAGAAALLLRAATARRHDR